MKKIFFIIAAFLTSYLSANQDGALIDIQKNKKEIQNLQMPLEKIRLSKVIEITSMDQLKKEIESSKIPVFVDCYSSTCPPCRALSPIFDKYSMKQDGYAKFLKVNVSEVREIAEIYNIRGVPSLLIFEKDGNYVDKKLGLPDITKYLDYAENKINKLNEKIF